MVVLPGGIAMFPGTGKHMAKDYDVSYDRFFVSVTVTVVIGLGTKPAHAEGECWVAHRLGTVTLLHICS